MRSGRTDGNRIEKNEKKDKREKTKKKHRARSSLKRRETSSLGLCDRKKLRVTPLYPPHILLPETDSWRSAKTG